MKKLFRLITAALAALTCAIAFGACEPGSGEKTIVVGASSTPHAEILEFVKEDLKAKGYDLRVIIYTDYIMPNMNLQSGDLDANYFQHTPYLDDFNAANGTDIVAVEKIHYEPLAVYGNGVSREEFLATKTGRTIFIPSDASNGTRALLVLADNGYITLPEGAGPTDALTVQDIVSLNGNTVVPVIPEQVAGQLANNAGAIAVVNGNYALEAGLRAADALAVESAEGDAAQLYANIVAAKAGKENSEKIRALIEVLTTEKVHAFITETYGGAVLPVFTVKAA